MSLDGSQKRALKAGLRKTTQRELKALFALVRAHNDRTLLAALAPPKPKRRADPLVRELEQALRPIIAPAAEKADMLVEFMAKRHRRKLAGQTKGLADGVRVLRAHFSDEAIRADAKALVGRLTKLYGGSETVV